MAYENNDKKSINTSGMTTRNPNAEVPSALSVVYWDDMVKVSFAPELPHSQQTENRRYDYENSVFTTLSRNKCNELYNQYKEIIIPAIKSGENKAISVPIAGVHQFMIGTGVGEDGVPHPFVALIKNIDASTLQAETKNIIKYEFNRGEYILNYDPKTGKYDDRVFTYNELDLFMQDLNSFREGSSNAYVHTDRVVNKYYKDTVNSKLDRIGEKMGLDLAYKPRYGNGGNGGQGSIFDKPKNTTPEGGSTTVNSMEELDKYMQ